MYRVLKRDGKITDFKLKKIEEAITKAFKAESKRIHNDVISTLALKTVADFDSKIKNDLIEVEDIQDSVEKVLIESGFADVAKAFILYRKHRQTIRETNISYKDIIDAYLDDNRFDNTYSIGGLVFSNSLAVTSNYLVNELFDQEIKNAFNGNYLYLHDLQLSCGHSFCLSAIDIKDKVKPSDLFEFIYRFYGEIRSLTNEWSGPITVYDFDFLLSKYLKEGMDTKDLEKAIHYFFDMVNGPSGFKNQPLPLQLILDTSKDALKEETDAVINILLAEKLKYVGIWPSFTYVSSSLNGEFKHKDELVKLIRNNVGPIFESKKEGLAEKISYKEDYQKKYAGYGVDPYSGSLSLVSLNLARIAKESKGRESFFESIEKYLSLALRELEIKKRTSDLLFKENLYPVTATYIKNLDRCYLTIGITGLITMVNNLDWYDEKEDFKTIDVEVLEFINSYIKAFQKKKKVLIGMLPLTNNKVTDYFVIKDRELKPSVLSDVLDNRETYISLNDYVNETYDFFDYLELAKEFDDYFKSNNIVNVFVNKKDISSDTFDTLMKKIALYDLKSVRIEIKEK